MSADPQQGPPQPRHRPRWVLWAAVLAAVLVLALVAGTVVAFQTVRRSMPETSGTMTLPGLSAEVTVVRDSAGVPQIYADTPRDLFFAQGFVQAQDRFYEMDVRRHITAGRLAEMFGEEALDTDKVVRTLGWRRIAQQEVNLLKPQTREYLDAFSAGVNAYIGDREPSEMSLEYSLLFLGGLDYAVEDWTPVDSVAWLKAMAWDLRSNIQDEIDRAMAATKLTETQIEELYPAYPFDRHQPIVTGADSRPAPGRAAPDLREGRQGSTARAAAAGQLSDLRRVLAQLPVMLGTGDGIGSNAWAIDGEHSATGEPILANDPHLAPSLPGIWYQMGLHCNDVSASCPFDVAGFTFAGFPGVIIGHNRDIAWGMTNLGADVSDLYLEAVSGETYRRGKKWVPFDRRDETIQVAGGEPFTFTVRSSVHGPLLSDVNQTYASVGANAPVAGPVAGGVPKRDGGYAVALEWTALRPARMTQAVLDVNRAATWDEFHEALRNFTAPGQNMVYADRAGHIGYQATGLVPIRKRGNDGNRPAPGWDPSFDWTGRFVPYDAMPFVLDPKEGFIATANQAVIDDSYRYKLADWRSYGYRSQRIVDLLSAGGIFELDDMSRIQLDTRNGFAPVLVPHLLPITVGGPYYSAGQKLLRGWDFMQPADSAAAAYFNAVWRNLLRLAFADELPTTVEVDGGDRWWEVVRGLLEEPASPWWDDVTTDDVREDRDDVLRQAMRDARDELTRLQSRQASRWTWGHQHTLRLENQTVGQSDIGLIARTVNRGPWQLGGGSGILNANGWNAAEGYEVDWVPSMRMVVSLADLDDSTWVNLTGASGHAFSKHYTDQTDLWASGRTRSWPFTREAVADATTGDDGQTLRLVPAGSG